MIVITITVLLASVALRWWIKSTERAYRRRQDQQLLLATRRISRRWDKVAYDHPGSSVGARYEV